ncbi:UNVERIFIED_CONTAM: protein MAINTENANCE OF MERISTEMS [Sesamum calycinum]|uniref:Protein MAINTENANCE OF MERISTEMS n=1 Tax=Sesamum calycinum TaxID=2727403 RepID=A0AAW2NG10_9LAMI
MLYIGFALEEGALKGSRLQVKAIISHISRVHITPDTPHLTVVQYARAVALLLLGGTMCPDSSGNLVSYLTKLEDIVAARNYRWGSAVLAFLYRELCNASKKGKAAIGSALQLVQIWAWSCIIPLCPGLSAPRVHMGPHQIDNNRVLPGAPYGAMWNCEHTFTRTVRTTIRVIRDILDEMQYDQFIWQLYDMESNVIMAYAGDYNPQLWRSICPLIFYAIVEMHHPERVLRQLMMQNISDQPDTRDMSLHKITRSNRTGTDWVLQHILYITRWQRQYDTERKIEDIGNVDVEGYRQLVAQLEHEVQIIAEAIKHQPKQTATPSDSAHHIRQRRSSSQMSIGSVERGDIGVDMVLQQHIRLKITTCLNPQDYYVPQPSQDDWFQSTSYMPSHAEAYSSHVDLDLGLGINQPYAPEYNISPVPFPSFSTYRDNVESSSAASSSGLHINSGGDDNDGQNEPIQNMGEEIRRPRRQRHRLERRCCSERDMAETRASESWYYGVETEFDDDMPNLLSFRRQEQASLGTAASRQSSTMTCRTSSPSGLTAALILSSIPTLTADSRHVCPSTAFSCITVLEDVHRRGLFNEEPFSREAGPEKIPYSSFTRAARCALESYHTLSSAMSCWKELKACANSGAGCKNEVSMVIVHDMNHLPHKLDHLEGGGTIQPS